ncbi:MAG: general secretion pathway protein J [Pseudohongiellaceae bacterium]|jgi:general secretion pathway protein J
MIKPQFQPIAKHPQAGFTLLEVILAMAITAIIALLGYNALSVAINTAEQHELKAAQLGEVQLALTVLERDCRNAVNRPITDEYGLEQKALLGGELAEYPLQLSRRGWDNPTEIRRGEIQRVRYEVIDNAIWREHWLVLDRQDEESSKQRVKLIDNVDRFELFFLKKLGSGGSAGNDAEWKKDWDQPYLPLAIKIEIELTDFGVVRRVFEIL